MSFDPGDYSTRYELLTPPGGGASDDRDADGWVDPHATAAAPTVVATIYGAERELSIEEKSRAGLDAAEGVYRIRTYPRSTITSRMMLRRMRDGVLLEIVHAPDHDPAREEIRLLARRAKH